MSSDPIVAEIRSLRERRAARFGFDVAAIANDARARDAAGDRQIVRRPPRRPVSSASSDSQATTETAARPADQP